MDAKKEIKKLKKILAKSQKDYESGKNYLSKEEFLKNDCYKCGGVGCYKCKI